MLARHPNLFRVFGLRGEFADARDWSRNIEDMPPGRSVMKRCAHALVLLVFLGRGLAAQQLPTAPPASVGISSERLERMHRGMQAFVDRREVAGIVTLVAREGKIVDVMMLYEEGKLLLTDPISKYIPSFRNQRVATGTATEPARRDISIRDLLSHRSGLSYGFLDDGPVGNAYRATGVSDGLTVTNGTIAENVDRLAAAPLVSQPGTEWHYSLSTDVLGRLVEVVSAMPFDAFLRERIFTPLGMTDTSFDVPDAKWSRLATVYSPDRSSGIRPMKDPETFLNTVMSPIAYYKSPKRYFSGGVGLTATIHDYARFAETLLNGGTFGNVRLLSPKTVELMTLSHTADVPPSPILGGGGGFGLGFLGTTDLARLQTLGSVGMYGWSGIYGTNFWVDPKEHLIGSMMVQLFPGATVSSSFQMLVYQALTRSDYFPALRTSQPSAGGRQSVSGAASR